MSSDWRELQLSAVPRFARSITPESYFSHQDSPGANPDFETCCAAFVSNWSGNRQACVVEAAHNGTCASVMSVQQVRCSLQNPWVNTLRLFQRLCIDPHYRKARCLPTSRPKHKRQGHPDHRSTLTPSPQPLACGTSTCRTSWAGCKRAAGSHGTWRPRT